jgi:hypothetical protein
MLYQLPDSYQPKRAAGLRVFLDNSNLWISGKRMAAQKLKLKGPWPWLGDPRFRIDYTKLFSLVEKHTWKIRNPLEEETVLRSSCKIVDGGVYGSDMVKLTEVINERGLRFVNIPSTGKREKQVDVRITVDIERLLRKLPKLRDPLTDQDVAILIAGDADFVPVVQDAIEEGFRFEIWGLDPNMAAEYSRLAHVRDEQGHPMLRTVSLDDFLLGDGDAQGDCSTIGYVEYDAKEYSNEATIVVSLENDMASLKELLRRSSARDAFNKWAKNQGRKWAAAMTERYGWPVMFDWQATNMEWKMVFYSLAHAEDETISCMAFRHCQDFLCHKDESIRWLRSLIREQAFECPWLPYMNMELSSTIPTVDDMRSMTSCSSDATGNGFGAISSLSSDGDAELEDCDTTSVASSESYSRAPSDRVSDSASPRTGRRCAARSTAAINLAPPSPSQEPQDTEARSLGDEGFQIVGSRHAIKKDSGCTRRGGAVAVAGGNLKARPKCFYCFNCSKGTACQFLHSEEEQRYYRQRRDYYAHKGDRQHTGGNPKRKTIMCAYGKYCTKWVKTTAERACGPECDFYHDESIDAWCTTCHKHGHLCGATPACMLVREV